MTEVMAIWNWKTNAELIRDAVVPLGYLRKNMVVLDPTYGKGSFYSKWRPDTLIACDLVKEKSPIGFSVDFRSMPFATSMFDAVVYDPPYRLNGTPDRDSDESYGIDVRMTWQARYKLIYDGMTECTRVLKSGGNLLVKCQSQVSSGAVRWQVDDFGAHARDLGLTKLDQFDMVSHRKQPPGRSQVHARRNSSTLLVFRK
jgi:hypothetical protein